MITVDLSGPIGNVFCLLGHAKSIQKQLTRAGTSNKEIDEVLKGYTDMEYDGIVAKLGESGFFEFENGPGNVSDPDVCQFCGMDFDDCDCDPKES